MEGAVDHFAKLARRTPPSISLETWSTGLAASYGSYHREVPMRTVLFSSLAHVAWSTSLPQLPCWLSRPGAGVWSSLDSDTFKDLPLITDHDLLIHLFGLSESLLSKSLCYMQRGPQLVTVRTRSPLMFAHSHSHSPYRIILLFSKCFNSILFGK